MLATSGDGPSSRNSPEKTNEWMLSVFNLNQILNFCFVYQD